MTSSTVTVRSLRSEMRDLTRAAEAFHKIVSSRPEPGEGFRKHMIETLEAHRELVKQYTEFKRKFEEVFQDIEQHKLDERFVNRIERTYLEVVVAKEKLQLHMPAPRWGHKN